MKEENQALLDAGLAKDARAAEGLRKRLANQGITVEEHIKANALPVHTGNAPIPSRAGALSEIRSIMDQGRVPFAEAKGIHAFLTQEGHSVEDWLQAQSMGVSTGDDATLSIFRQAGELIRLAGGVEKARNAVELYHKLANES